MFFGKPPYKGTWLWHVNNLKFRLKAQATRLPLKVGWNIWNPDPKAPDQEYRVQKSLELKRVYYKFLELQAKRILPKNHGISNPKNHVISKLVVWRSKRPLQKTPPNPLFLEGPSADS